MYWGDDLVQFERFYWKNNQRLTLEPHEYAHTEDATGSLLEEELRRLVTRMETDRLISPLFTVAIHTLFVFLGSFGDIYLR